MADMQGVPLLHPESSQASGMCAGTGLQPGANATVKLDELVTGNMSLKETQSNIPKLHSNYTGRCRCLVSGKMNNFKL